MGSIFILDLIKLKLLERENIHRSMHNWSETVQNAGHWVFRGALH